MIRSDAWDGKTGTHALTLKVELMHEAEKQGRQHHFLPLPHPAPAHVGAAPPTKPYPTVGPRQQGTPNPARRRPAGKALVHRRATPTGRPESRSSPAHVGAAPPATPYPTAGPRQQGVLFSRRVPSSRRASPSSPKGPLVPAGQPLFTAGLPLFSRRAPSFRRACPSSPVGPLPVGSSAAPFKSKFSRDNRYKKRKISHFQQVQPKIQIVSIKKSRAFRGKY